MSTLSRAALAALFAAVVCLPAAAQTTVGFTDGSAAFPENASSIPIKFTRTGSTAGDIPITFSIVGQFGYPTIHGLLVTIANGQTQTTRDVVNDWQWNDGFNFLSPRNFTLKIDTATGASIGNATMALTINEVPDPLKVILDDVTVTEGTGGQTIATFTLRGVGERDDFGFDLQLITHDGTAHAGSDFIAPQTVHWYTSERTKLISVPIIADGNPEGDETFSLEILPASFGGWNVNKVKLTATCTIIDDDDAIGPDTIKIQKSGKGQINVQFTDPAATSETVTFMSLNPSVASVPPSVTIPAGMASATVDVSGVNTGSTTILANAPLSRGGRQFELQTTVFEPAFFTFDRTGVTLDLGATTTVQAKMDPPPPTPLEVAVTNSNSKAATIPTTMMVGTDGVGTLTLKGIAAGSASVIATLPETRGGTQASLHLDVTVPTGFAITGLSKDNGRAAGNERVKIFANNASGRCVVLFGGIPSPDAQIATNGSVDAATPPHDAGTVDVTMKCGTDSSTYKGSFTFMPSPLKLSQISPVTGTTGGGTIVRLTGENLQTSGCEAWFGNAPARTIATTQTTDLVVAAPAHDAASVAITLRCGSQSSILGGAFNYFGADDPLATITEFVPATAKPGDRVTVVGSNFHRDDAILIGGVKAIDVATTAIDKHTITIPELATGSAAVTLRDFAGRSISGPSLVIAAPVTPFISRIATSVASGAELTISGASFRRALKYTIGSTALTPIVMTATDAAFRVPPTVAAGATQFVISDGDKPLITRNITVTAGGINVSGVNPPCASEMGGALVTISGAGFEAGAIAQFGSAYSADAVVKDANTIVAHVPPSFGTSQPVITIFNRSGSSSTISATFTYTSQYDGCGSKPRGARH